MNLTQKEAQNMSKKRRNHSAAFKAKVALEAIKGEQTLSELSTQFALHPNQIQQWKKPVIRRFERCFWCIGEKTKTF